MQRSTTWLTAAIAVASLFSLHQVTISHARAELLAYEGFNYGAIGSDLLGKSGGTGFSGNWISSGFNASIHTNFDIASGSLNHPPLFTTGNRVVSPAVNAISGLGRALADPIVFNQNKTVYFSVLLEPTATLGSGALLGYFGMYLDAGTDLFIGKPGSAAAANYVIEERGGAGKVFTNVPPVVGETVLLVLKGEFKLGIDKFTLYVNPTPGAPEPAVGTVKNIDIGTVSGLTIYSTGAFAIDEIRVGTTFADVVPVPEPASGLLAAGGFVALAALALRRQQKR